MLGLPENAVKESMLRVDRVNHNSVNRMPRQKIVVDLAPADIRKEGSAYDLAIVILDTHQEFLTTVSKYESDFSDVRRLVH